MSVTVRRLAAGEGALLRTVRLCALADAPLAFGSNHEREAAWPMARWEAWAASAAEGGRQVLWLAEWPPAAPTDPHGGTAVAGPTDPHAATAAAAPTDPHGVTAAAGPTDAPAGLASGVIDDEDPALAHLYSMWVAPEARRRGAAAALVEAVAAWARDRGAARLRTSVTLGNAAAARLYERAGFADTGERSPLGHHDAATAVLERRLARDRPT